MYGQPINVIYSITILGIKYDAAGNMVQHCDDKAVDANRRINLLRILAGRRWGGGPKPLLPL